MFKKKCITIAIGYMALFGIFVLMKLNLDIKAIFVSYTARFVPKDLMPQMPGTTIGFVQELNNRRRKIIKEFCAGSEVPALNETITRWSNMEVNSRPRIFYSDSMKLIVCDTPRCGTNRWRNLMLIMDGHLPGYEAGPDDNFGMSKKNNFVWSKFNPKTESQTNDFGDKLHNYYKIMITREPLQRLVSAYREKLETNANGFYSGISKKIHSAVNPDSPSGLATFEEFIDYVLSTKRRIELDPHWKPFSELCDPCNINYDYIARTETLHDDSQVITGNIGISRDRIHNSTEYGKLQDGKSELYRKYYLELDIKKRDAIFKYYKDQYDMFGYDYPDFISTGEFSKLG